jgi:hypothetical protein
MKRLLVTFISLCMASFGGSSFAGVDNDIPSCYVANKVAVPVPQANKAIFVLIDQTTLFDENLKNEILQNSGSIVKQGNAYAVVSFSSYAQGRYLDVISTGLLEGQIEEKLRGDLSMKMLKNFDNCLVQQVAYGQKIFGEAIQKGLSGAASDIAKSDILAALKEISKKVKDYSAKDKIVFLASDMLENSSVSTFYGNHSVRLINPDAEMQKTESSGMIGDFGGARVFVLGAGLMQENAGKKNSKVGIYRDPKTVGALHDYWEKYFIKSNAKLVEFGAPAMVNPVK